MTSRIRLLDDAAMSRALQRMALEIVERAGGTSRLVLVGIQRRGVQDDTDPAIFQIVRVERGSS